MLISATNQAIDCTATDNQNQTNKMVHISKAQKTTQRTALDKHTNKNNAMKV